MDTLKPFIDRLEHALRNLLPIIVTVVVFQALVLQQVPEGVWEMVAGLAVVVVGIALFLQGLDWGIFPVARSLSDEFTAKGSLPWLMIFGFCLGFSAVIAEPALIAVAEQAQQISHGRIDPLILRGVVAFSVGLVVALGVLRIILGHWLHWYVICGYITVVAITFFSPDEIVGLAYDSGGVTTNIVTVPLIAALGLGLAASIRGRNPLSDGFGLVALVVMVPMIVVQLYGIAVYGSASDGAEAVAVAVVEADEDLPAGPWQFLRDLVLMFRDVAPIILVVAGFQYLVIRKHLPRLRRVAFGMALVVLGLYAFVIGLKLGLFPIGRSMAEQLIARESVFFLYLFAFLIGFATTMAEPALIAIGRKAEEAAKGRIDGNAIRLLVAFGVGVGIAVGVHRIVAGDSIHLYIMAGYALVILLTVMAPTYFVALAYDLGGVTASAVTVPLVTALGIGLATHIEGRSVLIDGFGLIAFASIFPIITILIYAIAMERLARKRGTQT